MRKFSPRPVPRSDPRPGLDLFTRELQESNKLVCGNTFKLEEKPLVEAVRPSEAGVGSRACARVGWGQPRVQYRAEEQRKRSHQQLWGSCQDGGDDSMSITVGASKLSNDSGYSTDLSQAASCMTASQTSKLPAVKQRRSCQ